MTNKNIGRPVKVTYQVMNKLVDALEHGASVSEACNYAGISRDTYYRHLQNNEVFNQHIGAAKQKQPIKVSVYNASILQGLMPEL